MPNEIITDADYWTRNVEAFLRDYGPDDYEEQFEVEPTDDDTPEAAVVELTRTDDVSPFGEDEWVHLIVTLQRRGFEVMTNEERPPTGAYILHREPLPYPFADADREEDHGK